MNIMMKNFDVNMMFADLWDYTQRVKSHRSPQKVVVPHEDPRKIIHELGIMRNSLIVPPVTADDAFQISVYCFGMIRNFGVAAFGDPYVQNFVEALQLLKNRESIYRTFRFLLFPKSFDTRSRMRKAIKSAYPKYVKVKSKLDGLGFKKGFRTTSLGITKLKENFPVFMKDLPRKSLPRIEDLISGKRPDQIANMICASEFNISANSFPRVRQQSRKERSL